MDCFPARVSKPNVTSVFWIVSRSSPTTVCNLTHDLGRLKEANKNYPANNRNAGTWQVWYYFLNSLLLTAVTAGVLLGFRALYAELTASAEPADVTLDASSSLPGDRPDESSQSGTEE